jgi:hypothetical protein
MKHFQLIDTIFSDYNLRIDLQTIMYGEDIVAMDMSADGPVAFPYFALGFSFLIMFSEIFVGKNSLLPFEIKMQTIMCITGLLVTVSHRFSWSFLIIGVAVVASPMLAIISAIGMTYYFNFHVSQIIVVVPFLVLAVGMCA